MGTAIFALAAAPSLNEFIYLQLNSAFLVLRPSPCTELRESAGLEGATKSQLSKEFVLKMGLMRE
jgi:hypothetical protein